MAGWFKKRPAQSEFQRLVELPRSAIWTRLLRWLRRNRLGQEKRPKLGASRSVRRPLLRRVADPVFYLKAVIAVAALGLVILPLLADVGVAAISARGTDGCRVVSVTDGDTVRLWCPAHGLEKARLTGFDTPEAFSPKCASEFARATAATWYLRSLLIEADKISIRRGDTDRYGRRLVSMRIDGIPLSRLMIRAGHARAYNGGPRSGWC